MKNSNDQGSLYDPAGASNGDAERTVLDWPRHAGLVDRMLPAIAMRVRRRRQRRIGALAAGLAAALAIGFVWSGDQDLKTEPARMAAASPLVLPITEILSDGSVVQLRDGAEFSVAFDEGHRRVFLRKGEAHFQVTKNNRRPFVVVAGGIEVRAVGTAFGVQFGSQAVEVIVTEGRVALSQEAKASAVAEEPVAPATLAVLDAGNRAKIGTTTGQPLKPEIAVVTPKELDERLGWRVPRLDLSNTPLDEVVTLFYQFGRTKFVLADPALAKMRISGMLRVDHPELLVRLLERDLGVRAEYRSDEEIYIYKAQ